MSEDKSLLKVCVVKCGGTWRSGLAGRVVMLVGAQCQRDDTNSIARAWSCMAPCRPPVTHMGHLSHEVQASTGDETSYCAGAS